MNNNIVALFQEPARVESLTEEANIVVAGIQALDAKAAKHDTETLTAKTGVAEVAA